MDIYDELGVRKVINATGPVTRIGGSLMPPAVMQAMVEANRAFVSLDELLAKAGQRIAELIGVDSAFITSGAAAGLAISAAACMAGADPARARQLPDTTGMKDEFVCLRAHRIPYDQAIRLSGARIVDVGYTDSSTLGDLAAAISNRTAAVLYVAKKEKSPGSLPLRDVLNLAKDRGLPVIVDAADELPPASNLRRFADMGADLTIFSGGKDLRGPQASGLILGRRALIAACAVNACPNYGIGRPMKASKEAIAGLVRAVELYLKEDAATRWAAWEAQRDYMVDSLSVEPCLRVRRVTQVAIGAPGSHYLPALLVDWDENQLGLTRAEACARLQTGDPGIVVDHSPDGLVIRVQMLQEGEERVIVKRLRDLVSSLAGQEQAGPAVREGLRP
ncbi:MAG: aminotransferase class V-fold PLP-dependent enzyme [Anaerolineae bacterium]